MTEPLHDARHLLDMLADLYQHRLPFNALLGLEVTRAEVEQVRMELASRHELIGNFVRQALHGGVVASILDAAGGLMASAALVPRAVCLPAEDLPALFAGVSTIDMRVDYLRPATGRRFIADARPLRCGRSVTVVRAVLADENQRSVAEATAAYRVG